jgi:type VI protein secretion system component VasF
MQKSHDPRRDLIDTYAAAEHLVDAEAHIAQSHCAAVNRDLLAALKWLVWAVDFQRVSGEATDPEDLKAALVAARTAIAKAGG